MRGIRIAGHPRIHEGAAHHIRHLIDQRMMNDAVRDVHDAVSIQLEQPQLGRAQAAADREAGAVPKARSPARNHRYFRQSVRVRQFIECASRSRRDAGLAKPGTAWTGWPMRTRRWNFQQARNR